MCFGREGGRGCVREKKKFNFYNKKKKQKGETKKKESIEDCFLLENPSTRKSKKKSAREKFYIEIFFLLIDAILQAHTHTHKHLLWGDVLLIFFLFCDLYFNNIHLVLEDI